MGAGKKSFHAADVDGIAALDAVHDPTFDNALVLLNFLELIKDLHALGPLKRQGNGAVIFILAYHINVDLIADLDVQIAISVTKFSSGNLSL